MPYTTVLIKILSGSDLSDKTLLLSIFIMIQKSRKKCRGIKICYFMRICTILVLNFVAYFQKFLVNIFLPAEKMLTFESLFALYCLKLPSIAFYRPFLPLIALNCLELPCLKIYQILRLHRPDLIMKFKPLPLICPVVIQLTSFSSFLFHLKNCSS